MMSMQASRRQPPLARLTSLVFVVAAAGCPDIDIDVEPGQIACAADEDCPGEFRCLALGRCATPEVAADITPPTATLAVTPDVVTRGTALTLTLTVTDDSPVQLPVLELLRTPNDAITTTLTSQTDNVFVYAVTIDANENARTLTPRAIIIDLAGNRAEPTFDPVSVDLDGPVIDIDDIVITFDGDEAHGRTHASSGARLTLAVTVDEPGATINGARVIQGAAIVAVFTRTGDAFDTLTLPTLDSELDPLLVEIDATDANGNRSTTRSLPIAVDLTPPATVIDDLRFNGLTATQAATLTEATVDVTLVAARDAIAFCARLGSVGCTANADFRAANATVSLTLPTVPTAVSVHVVTRDRALLETSITHDATVIPDAPTAVLALTPPANQTAVKPGDTITISGTAIAGASLTGVLVDATTNLPISATPFLSITLAIASDGTVSQTFVMPETVVDNQQIRVLVGGTFNGQTVPTALSTNSLRVDLSPPTVAVSTATPLTATADVVVAWQIAGASSVEVTGDVVAGSVGAIDIANATSGTVALTLSPGDGDKTVTFTVRDDAGQSASDDVAFQVDSNIPVVDLLIENVTLPVAGVRPTSLVGISGIVSAGVTVVSSTLFYLDESGVPLNDCTEDVDVIVTDTIVSIEASIIIDTCAGAANVQAELIVQSASGISSIVAQSRSNTLFYDDANPVIVSASIDFDRTTGPGVDAIPAGNPLVTPTANLTLTIAVDDASDVTVTIRDDANGGPVTITDGSQAATSITLTGGDGNNTIELSFADAVGNVTTTSLQATLDTAAPAAPSPGNIVYVEAGNGDDLDAGTVFTISGESSAVEGSARVFVFAPSETTPANIVNSDAQGAFDGVNVTALGTPVIDVLLVAVDDAGNRSAPTTASRPTFSSFSFDNAADAFIGPTKPGVFSATVTGDTVVPVGSIGGNGDDIVESFNVSGVVTVIVPSTAAGGVPEGPVTVRVAARNPALSTSSITFDNASLTADYTAPTVASLTFIRNGNIDSLFGTGAADASNINGRIATATIGSESRSSEAIDGGEFLIQLPTGALTNSPVEFSLTDIAGNELTQTLAPPTIDDVIVSAESFLVGDTVTVTVAATAAAGQSIASIAVTIGGRAATCTGTECTLVVTNSDADGPQDIVVTVLDSSGHRAQRTLDGEVTFILNPKIAFVGTDKTLGAIPPDLPAAVQQIAEDLNRSLEVIRVDIEDLDIDCEETAQGLPPDVDAVVLVVSDSDDPCIETFKTILPLVLMPALPVSEDFDDPVVGFAAVEAGLGGRVIRAASVWAQVLSDLSPPLLLELYDEDESGAGVEGTYLNALAAVAELTRLPVAGAADDYEALRCNLIDPCVPSTCFVVEDDEIVLRDEDECEGANDVGANGVLRDGLDAISFVLPAEGTLYRATVDAVILQGAP